MCSASSRVLHRPPLQIAFSLAASQARCLFPFQTLLQALFLCCLTCPMYTYGYMVLWRYAADTCICSMQPVWLSSVGAGVQFNHQLSETTFPLPCTWARAHKGYSVQALGKGTGPGPSYRLVPTLWLGAMSMVSVTAS